MDLIDLLLEKKNYFHFDGEFHFQVKGVSMGSSFSLSSANLFMATLEEKFILNKDQNPFFDSIFTFYRYIDDCFCVYTNADNVRAFLSWLNGLHPSINFTFEGSESFVNFLDTIVYKTEANLLPVKPFVKTTDMTQDTCKIIFLIGNS